MNVVLFPLEKFNQFVLDFPSALVTFHFHMLFLIEKEHTDAKNCRVLHEKSKFETRSMNGSIINLQVF